MPSAKVFEVSQPVHSPNEENIQHQILLESSKFLYSSMPSAALGHTVAGAFVVFALYDVVAVSILHLWFGCLFATCMVRLAATRYIQNRLKDAGTALLSRGSSILAFLALAQTSLWGASTFIIWPDDIAYRAVLVAILAGIIAAGGIMLALHRRSFMIYCLPITIPAVIQLLRSSEQLEQLLAGLLVFYLILLLLSVNRLSKVFLDGLRLLLLMQNESRTDALTTLANRRGFDESFYDLWQQSVRAK